MGLPPTNVHCWYHKISLFDRPWRIQNKRWDIIIVALSIIQHTHYLSRLFFPFIQIFTFLIFLPNINKIYEQVSSCFVYKNIRLNVKIEIKFYILPTKTYFVLNLFTKIIIFVKTKLSFLKSCFMLDFSPQWRNQAKMRHLFVV